MTYISSATLKSGLKQHQAEHVGKDDCGQERGDQYRAADHCLLRHRRFHLDGFPKVGKSCVRVSGTTCPTPRCRGGSWE